MNAKLKPEIKAEWVAALRSGEYTQGKSYLHTQVDDETPEFCCLGVLCDVAVKVGVLDRPRRRGDVFIYDGAEGFPPSAAYPWAYGPGVIDLNWSVPRFVVDDNPDFAGDEDIRVSLADLNDIHGWTFERIADVVEEFL